MNRVRSFWTDDNDVLFIQELHNFSFREYFICLLYQVNRVLKLRKDFRNDLILYIVNIINKQICFKEVLFSKTAIKIKNLLTKWKIANVAIIVM